MTDLLPPSATPTERKLVFEFFERDFTDAKQDDD